jgi:hypothetical protein
MRDATLERVKRSESAKVARWRRECLLSAGYDWRTAVCLANRAEVDLHAAVELVRRGCPPATAVAILV